MKRSQRLTWSKDFRGRPTPKKPPKKKAARVKNILSRNPFLNFLRDFRNWNPRLASSQLMQKGAELWRSMSDRHKLLYCQLAKHAPVKKKKKIVKAKRGNVVRATRCRRR
ncbi:hypothetical protein Zmor_010584 [Zophobas morio]|uniref:HMG box domain-containing protein n=1 Tax=Zophobas morio TaxID=2755281 RepID=A0AA38MK25_9CUCU|nr:hypothetical protein Zmor_010584 [Zophobas morio]